MEEIFNHFISRDKKDDSKRVGNLMWFNESFPASEFTGEDLLMKLYCDYSAKLSIPLKYKYFCVFLSTELKRILIETGVRVPGTDDVSYADPAGLQLATTVVTEYMQNEFQRLESLESDVEDFPVAASEFMNRRLNERVVEELGKSFEMLTGSENSDKTVDYTLNTFVTLSDVYDKNKLLDLTDRSDNVNGSFTFVCDTGIPVIDNDIVGIYTSQMIGLEAQPGAGKTRFALGVWAYRAAVMYKKNVIYYQLEQERIEAEAMLVARHCFYLYNIQISSAMIQFDKVPDELKSKVEAARIDLFMSGKYGKIYIKNTNLYYDTLIQTFRTDDKMHGPFDMIIVDYIGLIMQKHEQYKKELLDYKVIDNSYRLIKGYVRDSGKCAVAVGQFNEKGITAGESDKDITPNMVQGGIAAYRHADQNLALSATKVMKAQQKLRVSQPKIRGTAGFNSAVIDTRLGFCYFYQNVVRQI